MLAGSYRIDAVLGRGGMGEVYGATDVRSGERVAVKVVREGARDHVMQQRLHREALAASKLRSDYVPRVLEVRETDDGDVFLVMERLEGEALSQRLRSRGCLAWNDMAAIGEDVLRALIDAHTAGVVHRDLKPSNVFITEDGRARVLDFGVCRLEAVDHERLTGTGEAIGTVAYMAPEQIRGASSVTDRADLYAFGVLVYECLTGWLPHEGATQMSILASKLERPAAPLVDERGAFPSGLPDLVARLLEREPELRFESAQKVLRAWRDLGEAAHPDAVRPRLPMPSGPETLAPRVPTPPVSFPPRVPTPPVSFSPRVPTPGTAFPLREEGATQTSLTTGVPLRGSKSARAVFAIAFAGVALGAIGLVVVATRSGPQRGVGGRAAATTAQELPPPESAAPVAEAPVVEPATSAPAAATQAAIELPADPPPAATRTKGGRPLRRPATSPSSKPHGRPTPHITTQPRY